MRRIFHVVWLLLAALDACLLVYLTLSYRWFAWSVPQGSTPAGVIVFAIFYGVVAFVTALAVGVVAAIGAGIVRQFRAAGPPSRWLTALAVAPLGLALLFALFEWFRHLLPVASIVHTARVDRLLAFEQFMDPAESAWRLQGLVSGERISIGLYLGVIVALAYLSEKYLLGWLRVRWPVPLVPIAMVASLAWVVAVGERKQREFVASRTWHPVAEARTFPQALQACDALGPDWMLPRPAEARAYLATRPEAIRSWQGVLWTNTTAERGGTRGIVVEIAPRKTGVWRARDVNGRSVSACEVDTRDRSPIDAFTRQKARLCEATPESPYLHPTAPLMVVLRRGTAAEYGQAGAVCVQRSGAAARGPGTQQYADQRESSTAADYVTFVKDYCASRTWPTDFICLTVGADPLPFEENGAEWLYRLACDDEGRAEGCAGYARLMDLRGETERAREYRARVDLLASRRK